MDDESQEQRWTSWLERSLDGDCVAYEQLLTQLVPALRRVASSRARSAGLDPEDVVQEVLLALHIKRNTWIRGTPVAPWVAAIARNKIVDAYRRRGRHAEVSIDSVAETLEPSRDDVDFSRDLERGLSSLPARQRAVIEAVSLEGRTAGEAAARLRMSPVGVRVTLHRALKALAALLSADDR